MNLEATKFETIRSALCEGERVTLFVNGDCMAPVLGPKQEVRIHKAPWYLPGDIVVYYCAYSQRNVAHRLLGKVYSKRGWKYLIKADNVNKPDGLVDQDRLLGRVSWVDSKAYRAGFAKRISACFQYIYWVTKLAMKQHENRTT